MKSAFALLLLLVINLAVKAQNYDASLIPKELLPYASAVVRSSEQDIEVKDMDNVLVHVKNVITILNKNGDDMAHMFIEHDKSNTIKFIKGIIYNEFGKQTGKFSEGDFDDVNAGHDFSLFEDYKVKHYLPSVTEYPYTIAYEYETRSKQTLNFDPWKPNPYYGVAIEKSVFVFKCKPGFKFSYKEINYPGKVNSSVAPDGSKTCVWQITNLLAKRYEPFSPYEDTYLTSVQLAPEKFQYYGVNGSFTNWNELGKWVYNKLVANRQELPAATIAYVRELTKNITDPKEKAKKIYQYMQGKTHYVSVQIGIGGYQPFQAADVDQQNYGDCKALVNYTQALLKAVNIDSYYCVVQSGRDYKVSLLNDFASMEQGDHIILCLPFKKDTTWADCTSQTLPFGYLGDFTDDRWVLACTREGGKLMHTPKYSTADNIESYSGNFRINDEGHLDGSMSAMFKGADYDDREPVIRESKTEQVKMLQRIYAFNNLNIDDVSFVQDKGVDPVTTEKIKLHAPDFASVNDGKYYFMLNPVDRVKRPLKMVRNRVNDVYINRGYTDEEELRYTIPAGYRLGKEPLSLTVDKPFGKFVATMLLKGDQLIYKRKLQLFDGTYSKDSYQDLVDFYETVYEADDYNVMLVKN